MFGASGPPAARDGAFYLASDLATDIVFLGIVVIRAVALVFDLLRPNAGIVRSPLDEIKAIQTLLADVYKDAGDGRTLFRERGPSR